MNEAAGFNERAKIPFNFLRKIQFPRMKRPWVRSVSTKSLFLMSFTSDAAASSSSGLAKADANPEEAVPTLVDN